MQLRGSFHGVVWIYGKDRDNFLAGPFSQPPAVYSYAKGRELETISAVAIGEIHGRSCLAAADSYGVTIYDIQSGTKISAPDVGSSRIWALSFGMIGTLPLLATGSDGGGVTVWDLNTRQRMAAIVLDNAVIGIWFVADQLVVATSGQPLSLFDVAGLSSAI